MASPQAPQDQDARAGINATTWVFTTAAIAFVILQLALKLAKHKALELNDWLIVAAAAIVLGQSIAVSEAVNNGLGLPISQITTLVQFQKAIYASQILYAVALGLAKAAAAYTASRISTNPRHVYIGRGLILASTLWTATALVSASLQCTPIDQAWQIFSNQCFDQVTFWDAIGSLDLVIDVAIVVLTSHIISTVDTHGSRKALLVMSFCAKLLAAPFLVTRLVLLSKSDPGLNPPLSAVSTAVVTQVQMSLAVLTSCVPYVRMSATHFEHGTFTTNMRLTLRRKGSKQVNLPPIQIRPPLVADRRYLDPGAQPDRHISVRGSVAHSVAESSLNSAKMIINKKMSFWVEEERVGGRLSRLPRTPRSPMPPVPQIQESFYEE